MSGRRLGANGLSVVALAAVAWAVHATPWPVVLGAGLPAAVLLGVLAAGDRRPSDGVAAGLWGAGLAALGAAVVNDAGTAWLQAGMGEARARVLAGTLVGPLVEEMAKGAVLLVVLWLRRGPVRTVADGIRCGAFVGAGFAFTENLRYLLLAAVQGGDAGLARALYLRGLLGVIAHPLFCATMGAALGARRRGALALGFVAAVAQHAAWNGVASVVFTEVLCNPATTDGACRATPDPLGLFVTAPLVALACLGPGVALLAVIARRDVARRVAPGCEPTVADPVARGGEWGDDSGAVR